MDDWYWIFRKTSVSPANKSSESLVYSPSMAREETQHGKYFCQDIIMKNAILIVLVLIVLILIIFRMSSSANPVNPPAPVPSPKSGPINNQKWFLVKSTESCPQGYSKPDPSGSPTVCKLNNS